MLFYHPRRAKDSLIHVSVVIAVAMMLLPCQAIERAIHKDGAAISAQRLEVIDLCFEVEA
jgi:hypothetical protein